MAAHHQRRLWGMLAGIALLLVICAVGAPVVLQAQLQPPTAGPFLAARARWQQRPFQQYRLVIDRHEAGAVCQQTLDVAGMTIQAVVENTCTLPFAAPPQTVDQLFADLERYTLTYRCGPNGCGCDWLTVSVTYHPQWGYPQQVRSQQLPAPWWQRWQPLIRGQFFCTLIGATGSNYSVEQLTANPPQP
jgi:hypothetical protein